MNEDFFKIHKRNSFLRDQIIYDMTNYEVVTSRVLQIARGILLIRLTLIRVTNNRDNSNCSF